MALLKQNHGSAAHWAFSLALAVAIHLVALMIKFNAASGAGGCTGSPENTRVVIAALEEPPAELDSGPPAPASYHPRKEPMRDTVAVLLSPSPDSPPPAAASHCSLLSPHKLAVLSSPLLPATQRPVNVPATPDAALDAGPLAAGGGSGAESGSGKLGGISSSDDGEGGFGSGIRSGSGDGSGDGTGSGHSGSGEGSGRGAGGRDTGFGGVASTTCQQTASLQLRLAGKPVYPRACRRGLW